MQKYWLQYHSNKLHKCTRDIWFCNITKLGTLAAYKTPLMNTYISQISRWHINKPRKQWKTYHLSKSSNRNRFEGLIQTMCMNAIPQNNKNSMLHIKDTISCTLTNTAVVNSHVLLLSMLSFIQTYPQQYLLSHCRKWHYLWTRGVSSCSSLGWPAGWALYWGGGKNSGWHNAWVSDWCNLT